MSPAQLSDVARFCNSYPTIEVRYDLDNAEPLTNENVELTVACLRDEDTLEEVDGKKFAPPVIAPFYPQKRKEENWWLVLGEPATNQLLSIKRLTVNEKYEAKLQFTLTEAGRHNLKLYFMCDSYLGADQEFDITVQVEGRERNAAKKRRVE